MNEIEKLQEKLRIATRALNDIKNWDDDTEEKYGDPGDRASTALTEISKIK